MLNVECWCYSKVKQNKKKKSLVHENEMLAMPNIHFFWHFVSFEFKFQIVWSFFPFPLVGISTLLARELDCLFEIEWIENWKIHSFFYWPRQWQRSGDLKKKKPSDWYIYSLWTIYACVYNVCVSGLSGTQFIYPNIFVLVRLFRLFVHNNPQQSILATTT